MREPSLPMFQDGAFDAASERIPVHARFTVDESARLSGTLGQGIPVMKDLQMHGFCPSETHTLRLHLWGA